MDTLLKSLLSLPGGMEAAFLEQRMKEFHVTSLSTSLKRGMRTRVRSLASLSGLIIRHCRELWCRLKTQLRSGVAVAVLQAGRYISD